MENYARENPGAKYGMKAGTAAAKAATSTMKEIQKNAGVIALKGTIAFAFIGSFMHQFLCQATNSICTAGADRQVHAPGESGRKEMDIECPSLFYLIHLQIGGRDLETATGVTRADPGPDLERAQVECTATPLRSERQGMEQQRTRKRLFLVLCCPPGKGKMAKGQTWTNGNGNTTWKVSNNRGVANGQHNAQHGHHNSHRRATGWNHWEKWDDWEEKREWSEFQTIHVSAPSLNPGIYSGVVQQPSNHNSGIRTKSCALQHSYSSLPSFQVRVGFQRIHAPMPPRIGVVVCGNR